MGVLSLVAKGVWWLFFSYIAFSSVLFAYRICTQYLFGDFKKWDEALPKMNQLWFPAFGMYVHWIGGFLILTVGLVQLFAITRSWDMRVHRVLGTIYITGCFMASLGSWLLVFDCALELVCNVRMNLPGGNLFIYTSGGCVGGLNMDIAFSIAGWTMFILAAFTLYYARQGERRKHRDFAIRSIPLSAYALATGCLFHRPVDEFFDWWFFVPNLFVCELVVYFINKQEKLGSSALEEALLQEPTEEEEREREQEQERVQEREQEQERVQEMSGEDGEETQERASERAQEREHEEEAERERALRGRGVCYV